MSINLRTRNLLKSITSSYLHIFAIVLLVALVLSSVPVMSAIADTNWALQFDGMTDRVKLDTTHLVMGPGWQTGKTVTLWVNPFPGNTCVAPDASSCDSIFGDRPHTWGISAGLIPEGHHGGLDRIWVWNFDGTEDLIGIPYTPGEWAHIALVHDGATLRAYKNGILVGSMASGATNPGGEPTLLYIGGLPINPPHLFAGQIDEVTIWSRVLTQEEINQLMYQPLLGNEVGLAAYYQMSDGAGTALTDNSQFDWNGTLEDGGLPLGPLWVDRGEWVPPQPPIAPSDLNITGLSATRIHLAWTDNSTDEFSFEIERCTGSGCSDFAHLHTVLDNIEVYTDTDTAPSTEYCYRVRASNSGGASTYTNVACATTQIPLLMPYLVR